MIDQRLQRQQLQQKDSEKRNDDETGNQRINGVEPVNQHPDSRLVHGCADQQQGQRDGKRTEFLENIHTESRHLNS